MGITSARLGIKTRLQGWEVVPAGTHEARKAAEAAARGVGVKTGDSPAPWIDRLRAGSNLTVDGFTLWLENGQLQSSRTRPSEPDWQLDGSPPTELDQPDEYTVPEDDPDWPMLVELYGKVYQAQGHTGAHRWIEMLRSSCTVRSTNTP